MNRELELSSLTHSSFEAELSSISGEILYCGECQFFALALARESKSHYINSCDNTQYGAHIYMLLLR